ncbi:MAG: hypothetical protein Q8M01_08000 [Rubrivivax sp.]|nr:hypothetical protein [Rubrivivax sp.]
MPPISSVGGSSSTQASGGTVGALACRRPETLRLHRRVEPVFHDHGFADGHAAGKVLQRERHRHTFDEPEFGHLHRQAGGPAFGGKGRRDTPDVPTARVDVDRHDRALVVPGPHDLDGRLAAAIGAEMAQVEAAAGQRAQQVELLVLVNHGLPGDAVDLDQATAVTAAPGRGAVEDARLGTVRVGGLHSQQARAMEPAPVASRFAAHQRLDVAFSIDANHLLDRLGATVGLHDLGDQRQRRLVLLRRQHRLARHPGHIRNQAQQALHAGHAAQHSAEARGSLVLHVSSPSARASCHGSSGNTCRWPPRSFRSTAGRCCRAARY